MADLLKRLQISEQQYGVGMEDNPFQDASPDECMNVCFGGSGGGSPPPPPPQTMHQQTSNIPEYFQPYLERLFERGEAVTTEPFQRYEGQRLSEISPQQQAAYQGVEDMVGGYKPYIGTADVLTAQASQQSTDPTAVASRMSPYQQSVIDIQKREALRDANKLQQQIGAAATGAGAYGGSRQALQESELARQTGQRLADIQAVGSQQAYQQAMNQLSADRAASLAAGQQFAGLGAQQQQLGLAGLGALETVGGSQQAQKQKALDIGYEDFARETTYPQQQLQEMSSVLRGFNLPVSTYTTSQTQQAPPTFGQQAAGLGLGALGIYGAGKGVGLFNQGGKVETFDNGGGTGSSISDFLEKYGTPLSIAAGISPYLYMGARKFTAPARFVKNQYDIMRRMQNMTKEEKILYMNHLRKQRQQKMADLNRSIEEKGSSIVGGARDAFRSLKDYNPITAGARYIRDKFGNFRVKDTQRAIDEAIEAGAKPTSKQTINLPVPKAGKPGVFTQRGAGGQQQINQLPAVVSRRAMDMGPVTGIPSTLNFSENINILRGDDQDQVGDVQNRVPPPPPGDDNVDKKDTSTLDKIKAMLEGDEDKFDMSGINLGVAGLQALVEGENIRTGRIPVDQMGSKIGEVGQSFAAVDKAKREVFKDKLANLALLAGLEQTEANSKAKAEELRWDHIFKGTKLNMEQQTKIFEAVLGEHGWTGDRSTEQIMDMVNQYSTALYGTQPKNTNEEVIGESKTEIPLSRKFIKVEDGQLTEVQE